MKGWASMGSPDVAPLLARVVPGVPDDSIRTIVGRARPRRTVGGSVQAARADAPGGRAGSRSTSIRQAPRPVPQESAACTASRRRSTVSSTKAAICSSVVPTQLQEGTGVLERRAVLEACAGVGELRAQVLLHAQARDRDVEPRLHAIGLEPRDQAARDARGDRALHPVGAAVLREQHDRAGLVPRRDADVLDDVAAGALLVDDDQVARQLGHALGLVQVRRQGRDDGAARLGLPLAERLGELRRVVDHQDANTRHGARSREKPATHGHTRAARLVDCVDADPGHRDLLRR
ncbi:MAG: hypothetical protein ACK51M_20175, partial [Burkholderiales bacterium]